MTHLIDLRNVYNMNDLVKQVFFIDQSQRGDTLNIAITFRLKCVGPHYLAILASTITAARSRGAKINIVECTKSSFPSRMNFYKLLNIKYNERYIRKSSDGRLIEITLVDVETSNAKLISMQNQIMLIFKEHYKVNESVWKSINFCLWEILDNVKTHSGPGHKYTLVAHYIKSKDEIHLCVADKGIGIHDALTKSPESKFKGYKHRESVLKCTERHVTDGKGQGYGLYAYKRFVQANNGRLIIYSGNHYQQVLGRSTYCKKGAYWQGTIIYNIINTRVHVDIDSIFGSNVPTSVTDCNAMVTGLWEE